MSRLSSAGARLIASWEGFLPRVYDDTNGYATIGFGHVLHYSRATAADKRLRWSREHALKVLGSDAQTAVDAVDRCVKVPLNQNQLDALASAAFNAGAGIVCGSTLQRVVNRGDYTGVPDQLMRWVNDSNGYVQGLANRRRAEVALWNRGPTNWLVRLDADEGRVVAGYYHWGRIAAKRSKASKTRKAYARMRRKRCELWLRRRRRTLQRKGKRHGWGRRGYGVRHQILWHLLADNYTESRLRREGGKP